MRKGTLIEYDGLSLSSIEWSAVFAGTFFALGVGLILGLFGYLIGAYPVADRVFGFTGINALSGIWSVISAFVAFAGGGWLAARLCGSPLAGDGRVHGIVTWAFGTIAAIVLVGFDSHAVTLLATSLLNQTLLGRATLIGLGSTAALWALLAAVFGLIGGAIGGQIGGPRMVAVSERDETMPRRAA